MEANTRKPIIRLMMFLDDSLISRDAFKWLIESNISKDIIWRAVFYNPLSKEIFEEYGIEKVPTTLIMIDSICLMSITGWGIGVKSRIVDCINLLKKIIRFQSEHDNYMLHVGKLAELLEKYPPRCLMDKDADARSICPCKNAFKCGLFFLLEK